MRSISTYSLLGFCVAAFLVPASASAEPMTLSRVLALADRAPRANGARARVGVASSGFASANKLLRHNPTLRGGAETDALFDNDGDRMLSVGIEQTFELGGQQGLRRDIARAESDDGTADAERDRNDLKAEVAMKFHKIDTLARRVAVQRQMADLYQRLTATAQSLVARGSITRIDAAVVELEKSRVEAEIAHELGAVEAARFELGAMLGQPARPVDAVGDDAIAAPPASVDGLVASALGRRPELAALRARQRLASGHETLAAREAWLTPTVAVGIKHDRLVFGRDGFRFGGAGVPGLVGVDNRMLLAGVDLSVPIPLFEQRNTDRARARAELAVASADELTHRAAIEGEVRAAAAHASAAWTSLQMHEKTSVIAEETSALVEGAFSRGAVTLNEVIVAQERILRARLAFVAARGDLLRARVMLDRAVGTWARPAAENSPQGTVAPAAPPSGG